MKCLLVLLLTALLAATVVAQTCSLPKIKSLEASFNVALQNLDGDDVTTVTTTGLGRVVTTLTASDINSCWQLLLTLQNAITWGPKTFTRKTRDCTYEWGSTQWRNDTCCNPELSETQCCVARDVTYSLPHQPTVDASILGNACSNPELVKAAIERLYIDVENSANTCRSKLFTDIADQIEQTSMITECYTDVFARPFDCANDTQCYSNTCNLETGKCEVPTDRDVSSAVIKCLFDRLPALFQHFLMQRWNVTSAASVDELRSRFEDELVTGVCHTTAGLPVVPIKTTKESCLASKICNDGSSPTSCDTATSFCAQNCKANGECSVRSQATNKETCESAGVCFPYIQETSKATCENRGWCTNPDCRSCTQEACELTGFCAGPGANVDLCIRPFTYLNGLAVCPIGTPVAGVGCSQAANSKLACSIIGGRWVQRPNNEEDCLAEKRCKEPGHILPTRKTPEQCALCGGEMVSINRWFPHRYINAKFIPTSRWVQREVVPSNVWKQTLSLSKVGSLASKLVVRTLLQKIKTYMHCALGPIFALLRTFSCNCGLNKDSNECEKTVTTPAGIFTAFPKVLERITLAGGSTIDVKTDTVPEGTPSITFDIKASIALKLSSTPSEGSDALMASANSLNADGNAVSVVDSNGNVVGQVVGDCISVESSAPTSTGAVRLCLQRDTSIAVADKKHTVAAFATQGSDSYKYVSGLSVTSEDINICADVSDTKTYCPALVSSDMQSSASRSAVFGFAALLVALIFAL